jgi:hypothetical protein
MHRQNHWNVLKVSGAVVSHIALMPMKVAATKCRK